MLSRFRWSGEADDPQLQEFVDEATALRAEVTEIEKSEIGRVNNRIERLKRKPANSAITAELGQPHRRVRSAGAEEGRASCETWPPKPTSSTRSQTAASAA